MKAIITGMNGTVAPFLASNLYKKECLVIPWDRDETSIDNFKAAEKFFAKHGASHFFHIATGSPLWAQNVAEICFKKDIKFLFTGSVSVFDENSNGPFTINSTPNATDDYGLYKIECEKRVKLVNPEAIIARLGWQIGNERGSNNMVDYLFKMMDENGQVEASENWFPSCSFLDDTAVTLHELAINFPAGTYHLEGNPGLSLFQIATALKKVHGFPWEIVKSKKPARNNFMIDTRVKVKSITERF